MSAVGSLSLLDFVRGNRASSATIMATVGVSSFLLALLSGVLYGFWEDAAARTAAEGASLAERLGGELLVSSMLYLVVLALACVALVLIIRNAFLASMQNRVHQLGLLATVGATPRQMRSLLLREALVLSMAPAAIGIALGTLAAGVFINAAIEAARQAGVGSGGLAAFRCSPLLLLAVAALVLLTVTVSAGIPARKLARTSPLAAVAGAPEAAPARPGRAGLIARLFGVEGELTSGSLRQRRGALRSASLAIGLAFLALGLFLSFMTVSRMSVDQTYYERYGIAWDLVVDVPDASAAELEEVARGLAAQAEEAVVDKSDAGMRLYLKARAGAEPSLWAAAEEALESAGHAEFSLVDMDADRVRADAVWVGYAAVVGGFCGILALIGVAGVVTQAVGFVYQRKREFARLRSLGMTPGGVFKMLGVEGLLTVARPLALTLPLVVAGALALALLGRQPLGGFLAAFPYGVLLSYVAVVALVVVAANALGALRLVRGDLAEALRDDALA